MWRAMSGPAPSWNARRDVPIGELLEEWARCSAIVEPMIAKFDPLMRAMLLTDAVTHEHDVRDGAAIWS